MIKYIAGVLVLLVIVCMFTFINNKKEVEKALVQESSIGGLSDRDYDEIEQFDVINDKKELSEASFKDTLETVLPSVAAAYEDKRLTLDDLASLRINKESAKSKEADRYRLHKALNNIKPEKSTEFFGRLLAILNDAEYKDNMPKNSDGSINYDALLERELKKMRHDSTGKADSRKIILSGNE